MRFRGRGFWLCGASDGQSVRGVGVEIFAAAASHSHLHLDLLVGFVADDLQVLKRDVIDVCLLRIDLEGREGQGLVLHLLPEGLDVVAVDVGVPERVHKVAAAEAADVGDHAREQGVACDVEGHAEPEVARPLVHLAGEFPVRHVELAEHVAGRQRHILERGGVPRGEEDPPVVRVGLDLVDYFRELIDTFPAVVGVHVGVVRTKVPPLEAVDRSKITFLPVRQAYRVEVLPGTVTVPDVNVLLLQFFCTGFTSNKPQKLLCNTPPEHTLCSEQWERVSQIKTHLAAELRVGSGASSVFAQDSVSNNVVNQVEVLHFLVSIWHSRWQAGLCPQFCITQKSVPKTTFALRIRARPVSKARAVNRGKKCVAVYGTLVIFDLGEVYRRASFT
mmetsp:Transcript_23521/g.56245  ORF Transcript_23521/g.56245 Transcript_23521/m.56245 type:complete len:389 (-) Transcript_23521:616-1782(-)